MREFCSAWEILSQQTIGVLVAAALPRAAWIAEINLHVGGNREALVVGHLLAAIPSQGATQLRRQFAHLLSERGDRPPPAVRGWKPHRRSVPVRSSSCHPWLGASAAPCADVPSAPFSAHRVSE